MRDDAFDAAPTSILGGVPMPNQVRLENDSLAGRNQRTDRIPISRSEILGVETKAMKRSAHCRIDLVDGSQIPIVT